MELLSERDSRVVCGTLNHYNSAERFAHTERTPSQDEDPHAASKSRLRPCSLCRAVFSFRHYALLSINGGGPWSEHLSLLVPYSASRGRPRCAAACIVGTSVVIADPVRAALLDKVEAMERCAEALLRCFTEVSRLEAAAWESGAGRCVNPGGQGKRRPPS